MLSYWEKQSLLHYDCILLGSGIVGLSAAVSIKERYPDKRLLVLERGWLSSNNVLCIEDEEAALVDSGYVTHAAQTLALVDKALDGRRLTRLINTHSHSDHIGGMSRVLSNFPVGKVWDSGFIHGSPYQKNFYSAIQKKNIPFGRPKRGHSENMGKVLIEVLAPARLIRGTKRDANNNCLVLNITYGSTSFLMLADMEREERSTIGPLPGAAVLKASHHGSSNGTDMSLLKEVRPSLIILSYGRNNSYGYPHREVVGAVSAIGAIRLDTKDGTFRIVSDGEKLMWPKEREAGKNGG